MNASMMKESNRKAQEEGFPYSVFYTQTDDIFEFKYLRNLYYRITSVIREYLNDNYVIIIESPCARHAIHDKESYYKAITDGWLFQLEDEEEKFITVKFYRRA